ncbi:MAG: glycosyltransferase [Candidatus Tectomicrobia bacterium]|nr:glycosyltransferase [Candidatus Tectomicrobia bacterium]
MSARPRLRAALLSMHTDPLAPLGGDVTGGMNVYVRELARALPALGVEADVFTRACDPGAPAVAEIAPGARLVRIQAGPRRPLGKNRLLPYARRFAAGVAAFAREEGRGYGVLSCHYWLSGVAGEALAREWGAPLVLRFHTLARQKNARRGAGEEKEAPARARAEARLARRADALVVSSADEARFLAGRLGAPRERIRVIPCGVDPGLFAPSSRERARRRIGAPRGARIILSVGRIEPVKGLDRLAEALARIGERRPGLPVLALHAGGELRPGRGPGAGRGCRPDDFASPRQRAEVRRVLARARALGVEGSLRFIGAVPQEELPLYYAAADALAIPSRLESFSLVALEAAACGLPAAAFRVGGLPQAVAHGRSGLLVPDGDTGAFAEALLRLLEEPALRGRMGREARRRARGFAWPAIARKEARAWRRLLRPRRRGKAPRAWHRPLAARRAPTQKTKKEGT